MKQYKTLKIVYFQYKLLNLHELLQSIGDDRADLVVVCVDVLLKISSIRVVFCKNLFDHRTSEGLVCCSATMLSCLADVGIASPFIPGVEMRSEVARAFHTFTFLDAGYAQSGLGEYTDSRDEITPFASSCKM